MQFAMACGHLLQALRHGVAMRCSNLCLEAESQNSIDLQVWLLQIPCSRIARRSSCTLDTFTSTFIGKLKSVAGEIFGLKSIAAYRGGLEINTSVSRKDAEKGLAEVLQAAKPVCITNKTFVDYAFTQGLLTGFEDTLFMSYRKRNRN